MHDIQTVRITFTHQPHQPNCNLKHMYHNVLTRFVCWASRISRTVHMTYESMHTIPNWDTHEANCDRGDPNRETYNPHNPRDTNNSWPWWPQYLYKRIENLRIRHSNHHQVHPVYLHKKICLKKNVSKRKKATQKGNPPQPDYDFKGVILRLVSLIQQKRRSNIPSMAAMQCGKEVPPLPEVISHFLPSIRSCWCYNDFIHILVNNGLANFYEKFTGFVVGHPEGVADALGTVSCCQEPQCSGQSEMWRNGFFIVNLVVSFLFWMWFSQESH